MTPQPSLAGRDWSRPEFMRIARTVEEITGISFPPNRRASAETVMQRVMGKLGITNPVSLEIGVSQQGSIMEALLDDLTIGESYFFREPAQFRFMADELLPKWSSSWPAGRTLKVWSAACAAGQEPYSVAILLRENNWTRGSRIIGTDISEGRLAVAREASFTNWSLRTLPPQAIGKWFKRRNAAHDLLPEVKSQVEFAALNLLDSATRPETLGQDVIFCRNVLIYFEIPAVVQIAQRLLDSLAPEGWLFLGASDPHLGDLIPCEVVVLPGCTGYRKPTAAHSTYAVRNAPLTLLIPETPPPLSDEFAELDNQRSEAGAAQDTKLEAPVTSIQAAPAYAPLVSDPAERAIASARSLANEGRLIEAGEVCAAALDKFPDQPQLHLIAAVLSGEAGRWSDSERAAKRALYLDRSLVLAHVALGDALARLGNAQAARRSFENAMSLLSLGGDQQFEESSEMTSARLTDIVRAHLSMLDIGTARRASSASAR